MMEETLLGHYLLLSIRKAVRCTVEEFWKMDTFTTYKLLEFVNEIIEMEEKERKKQERKNKTNNSSSKIRYIQDEELEEDPVMTQRFKDNVPE